MVPLRCSSAIYFVAGVVLVSTSQVSAFVPGIPKGSCFRTSPALAGTSRAAHGARGYDEGVSRRRLVGRVQRWDARLAATPEEDVGASSAKDSSSSGSGGGEEEDAVWARAELPLSNDVQVEQANRAVWQVTDPSELQKVARFGERGTVELSFLSIVWAGTEGKHNCCSHPIRPVLPRRTHSPSRLCLTVRTGRF